MADKLVFNIEMVARKFSTTLADIQLITVTSGFLMVTGVHRGWFGFVKITKNKACVC